MPSQENTIRSLFEALPDAVVGVDRAGVIRLANRQAESFFGFGRDDLVGRTLEQLVPESLREVQAAHREDYEAAPSHRPMGPDLTLSGRRADGTEFPVDITLSAMDTSEGRLVFAAVRDLTDRRAPDGNGNGNGNGQRAARLLAIVEHSDDAIIAHTLDGIITSWNAGAERMYGYSRHEVIGRPIALLSPEGRKDEATDILARTGRGEDIDHIDTARVRKDGTLFQVSLSITPLRDAEGVIVGASTIARDVSEARQAFEAARTMIETSQDSLVAISPEGNITDVNEATVRLTGIPRDQLIGTSFSDYFTDPQKADEVYQRAFSDEPAADYRLTLRHRNGRETITEVLYNASAYRDAEGNVLGVFAASRDVTDQKKAAEYARSLIEATLESLVAISPDGRITDANQSMVDLTGIPREALVGTSFSDHFTDPEKAEAVYQQVFQKGTVTDAPLILRHINEHDSERAVLYNASVYRDANGAVLGVVATARDVTRQRQEAQYVRSLLEAALDPLVMISPQGGITDVNRAMIRLTGVPREELVGSAFSGCFTDPGKAEAIYQQAFEQESVSGYPLTLLRRGADSARDQLTEVVCNASVYRDVGGTVLGVFAAVRDVTGQLQAQRTMIEQQALEQARIEELERFQRLTVGRELKMIELKKEIEFLRKYGTASDPASEQDW